MFNYYINDKLVESYPKGTPRDFKYGETHYVQVVGEDEDETTRVNNEVADINEYQNYDYKIMRMTEYGAVEEQLEYITEKGVTAFKNKQMAVKARYPKNET